MLVSLFMPFTSRRGGQIVAAALVCLAVVWPVLAQARVGFDWPASIADAYEVNKQIKGLLPDEAPPSQVIAVASEAGSIYQQRSDGTWLIGDGARPGADTLTLALRADARSSFLRLDFPTDPSLPSNGPGVANNGNCVITEIEVEVEGRGVSASAYASQSVHHGGRVAATAFDGVRVRGDAGWDAEASGFETGGGGVAWVLVKLDRPIPRGAQVRVRLIARSKWNQHVPGTVRAALIGGDEAARMVTRLDRIRADYDAWHARSNQQLRAALRMPRSIDTIETDDDLRLALAQDELVRSCGVEGVWAVATRKDGDAFLRVLLSDVAWLESFLMGGTEGTGRADFAQSLENLRLLYSQLDAEVWDDPVSKRLATAMSLQAGTMNRYRFVERFGLTEQARHAGLLHAGFDQLDVRAMRHAINLGGRKVDFEHSVNDVIFTAGGYLGACWAVPYTDPSTYGFSIQGWGFHDPLRHAYPVTQIFRSIGGVCGTLSGFGANAAATHGVPAFTVGQPGHCAYVVRIGDRWATGNDVSGPATNSWGPYAGLSFISGYHLLEVTENSPAYAQATRLAWAARMMYEAAPQDEERWIAAYERSIAVQPLNYARWLEYIQALEASSSRAPVMTGRQWLALGRRAAEAFASHHEAGWALALRCFQAGESAVPAASDRVALLLETHKTLCQKNDSPLNYGYPLLPGFLNRQADWIADPAAAVRFFGELLSVHYSDEATRNWVFGQVLNWGSARFAGNKETSTTYAQAIGAFFATQGENANTAAVASAIAEGIRRSAENDDLATYHTWLALAEKLLPPIAPGDVYLNAQQLGARPTFDPFPGDLLSASGMLRISSYSYDKPLSYGQVLGGGELGYFDTAGGAKPWAMVTLAGEAELSGIVLVPRYEFPTEQPWHVPLKVEVSSDGKQWTEVAMIQTYEPVFRIDLRDAPVRVRYVRIERQPGPDAANPNNGRLHMRNFLVYGRKLY